LFTDLFNTALAAVGMAWSLLGSGSVIWVLLSIFFFFWKYGPFRNEPKTLGGVCAALSLVPFCLSSLWQQKASHLTNAMSLTQLGPRQLPPTWLAIQ